MRARLVLLIATAVLAIAVPASASAATRSVVSSGGSGSSDCIAPNPACTLTHALSVATSPDILAVDHGSYPVTGNFPLSLPNGVHVVGSPGLPRPTILRPTGTGCSSNCAVLGLSDGASLNHVTVVDQDTTDNGVAVLLATNNFVDDTLIEGVVGGITHSGTNEGGHIRTSVVISNPSPSQFNAAVWVNGNFTITQSTIVNQGLGNAVEGSSTAGHSDTLTIGNSAFKGGTNSTLRADNSSGNTMNIAVDYSVWNGVADNNGANATINNNSTIGDFNGVHDVVDVPHFADAEMRLTADSPGIDAALAPVTGNDLDGRPFTNGLGPDIGAYEYYEPVVIPPPPPPPPGVAAQALSGIKLSVGAKRKKGKLIAKVTCPAAAVGSCTGRLAVQQGKKTKTTTVNAIKPGKSATIKAKAKKGKTSITVTLTDGSGATGVKTASKKLK